MMNDNNIDFQYIKTKLDIVINNKSLKIAIAISGGSDSIATTHIIYKINNLFYDGQIKIFPIIVNHNLRPEANDEIKFVEEFLKKLNLNLIKLSWNHQNQLNNLQSRAREARYKLITDWCNANNISILVTGHHLDDQIETFIMRVERGSGLDGLVGIAPRQKYNSVYISRPMLHLTKNDLIFYLNRNKIQWVFDKSNLNEKFKRVEIRNNLSFDLQSKKRIGVMMNHLYNVRQSLNYYVKLAVNDLVEVSKYGYLILDQKKLNKLPLEVASRVFVNCLMIIGGTNYKPRYKSFNIIFNAIYQEKIKSNIKTQIFTLSFCLIKLKKDCTILIIKEYLYLENDIQSMSHGDIWDKRFKIMFNDLYQYHSDNYTFGKVYKSEIDIIKKKFDIKIDRDACSSMPVIRYKNEILYGVFSSIYQYRIEFIFYALLDNLLKI